MKSKLLLTATEFSQNIFNPAFCKYTVSCSFLFDFIQLQLICFYIIYHIILKLFNKIFIIEI